MRLSPWSSLLLLSLPSAVSSVDAPTNNFDRCLEPDEVDPSLDYFPEKAQVEDSKEWSIEYHNTYKILTNKVANISYLLYQCGTDPPADQVESGAHHLVLPVPLQGGVVVTQTTQIPHMELLGLRRQVKGYVGSTSYVSSPCFDYLLDLKKVEHIYDESDPWNATRTDELILAFLEAHPDAVVLGGHVEGPWGSTTGERRVIVSESKEKTSKAVFEWHEFYGALFNLEAMAKRTVEETGARHDCARSNAAVLTADLPEDQKPKILWAYWSATAEAWDVADCPNYYCEYASDCSTHLLSHPEGVGSVKDKWGVYLNDAEFLEHGKDADAWIFPSPGWNSLYGTKKDLLDQFKAVKNKRVFDYQGPGPNAWFEQRLAEYDVVLLDFCSVAGTASPSGVHKRRWFRNVMTEPVGDMGTCSPDDIDLPYVTTAAECELLDAKPAGDGSSATKARWALAGGVLVGPLVAMIVSVLAGGLFL